MNPRRESARPQAVQQRRPTTTQPAQDELPAPDVLWNLQMNRLLREAAEVRENRERLRQEEDDTLARQQNATLLEMIHAASGLTTTGSMPRTTSSHPRRRAERVR